MMFAKLALTKKDAIFYSIPLTLRRIPLWCIRQRPGNRPVVFPLHGPTIELK